MKPILTKTQIRTVSREATNCVQALQKLLAYVQQNRSLSYPYKNEKTNESRKICFPSLFNLYCVDSNWVVYGKGFEVKPPKIKKTISKKDIIRFISNKTGLTQKETSQIISSIDKIIADKVSACGARKEIFDLFGLGTLVVEAGKLSFTSVNHIISKNPLDYIKGIKINPREGFTSDKGGNLSELTLEMCTIILKKIKSRTPKFRGSVVGFEADPFHLPYAVTSVDAMALSALSKHKGFLGLDHIKIMNCEEASALSAYGGCTYNLEGKGNWPTMRRCGFTLQGINKISEEVAAKLSKFNDAKPSWVTDLNICWPGKYTSDEILHNFSGLSSISPEALKYLAKLKGHLDLSGLKEIKKEHAKALREHKGGVRLKGVKSISEAVAKELAKIKPGKYIDVNTKSWLYSAALIDLGGMKNIDIKACSALSHFKGSLSLGFFEILTADLAEVLKDNKYFIYLTFSSHERKAKEILSHRRDFNWDNSQEVG